MSNLKEYVGKLREYFARLSEWYRIKFNDPVENLFDKCAPTFNWTEAGVVSSEKLNKSFKVMRKKARIGY